MHLRNALILTYGTVVFQIYCTVSTLNPAPPLTAYKQWTEGEGRVERRVEEGMP